MKLLILISVFTAFGAQATVHQCTSGEQNFLLALNGDSGIAYERPHGFFQEMDAKVVVARAMDGGPTMVRLEPNRSNVTFKPGECWKMLSQTNFLINNRSTIQYMPVAVKNPRMQGCDLRNIPRPMVMPPSSINCKTL